MKTIATTTRRLLIIAATLSFYAGMTHAGATLAMQDPARPIRLAAGTMNPCHAKAMNPCHAKNPCHNKGKAVNPCHPKGMAMNPCHAKGKAMNPCHRR